ncbi:MAG: PAS domain-containing protein [Thermodesulfobacteriota bacterium]
MADGETVDRDQAAWNFRELFDGHSAMMFLVDRDSLALIDANRASQAFYGYSHDEFLGMRVTDLNIMPEPELRRELARAQAENRKQFEVQHRLKSGDIRHMEIRSTPIALAENRTVFFTIVHDITQRKQQEAKLRNSEQRYRWLVDNVREGIALIQDGRLVYVNPGTERITGYSAAELSDMDFLERMPPEDREMVSAHHARRLRGEPVPEVYEARIFHKDGDLRWVEISGVAIELDGQPATLNFITDITQRKRAEEERVQRERLQAAIATAGAACHELNQPLQGVLSQLELLLLRSEAQPELAHQVGRILKEARQMAEITQRLNRITDFRTRQYLDQSQILDLGESSADHGC